MVFIWEKKYKPWFQRFVQITFGATYRMIYKLKITGRENIPEGGGIICSNHPTANDPFLVMVGVGTKQKLSSMGKIELFQKNIWQSWFLYSMGAFPVDRENTDVVAIKQCFNDIKSGKKIIMFPEGTRTKNADGKAKGGAGVISAKMQCPVIPVYLSEEQKLFKKVEIIIGECMYPPEKGKKQESLDFAQQVLDRIFEMGRK